MSLSMNRTQSFITNRTKQYFKEELGEKSEDFLMLERLVKETNGRIAWNRLKKYTKIENGKVEGIYREGDLRLNTVNLGKIKEVEGTLTMHDIKKYKDIQYLKKVGGDMYLFGVDIKIQLEILKKIQRGELTIVGGIYGDDEAIIKYFQEELGEKLGEKSEDFLMLEKLSRTLNWYELYKYTKVKNGKVKGIYWKGRLILRGDHIDNLRKIKEVGNLFLGGSYITNSGELKKVKGVLNLVGATVELQLEIINKLKEGKLKVGGEITFGGDTTGIKKLLKSKNIPGNLYLRGTDIDVQASTMKSIKKGKLKVKGEVYYDEYINEIFTEEGKLDFDKFEETYGKKVNKIEGDQQEKIRRLLEGIKEFEKKYLEKEIVKVLKEDITQEEMKEKVAKLNAEYKMYMEMIDGYLDNKN